MNEMSPKSYDEIIAALAAQGCGIVRHRATPEATKTATPPPLGSPERDWLRVATEAYRPPTLLQLARIVSARTGVGRMEMESTSRNPRVVRARMIYYAAARKLTRWGTPTIGKKMGGRDHSTVLHGLEKVMLYPDKFEPELGDILAAFPMQEDPAP